MKRTITIGTLCLAVASVAIAEVRSRVCLYDANTPLTPVDANYPHIYPDIMVGTRLTIIIDSNVAEDWLGCLIIEDANMDYGVLSARDYDGFGYPGSCLPAAGEGAAVYDWEAAGIDGFGLYTGFMDIEAGDWFIIDYTATNIGNCNVGFYQSDPPFGDDILINYLGFTHVRTRDFNDDTNVDFADFAMLASYWGVTNCDELNWCDGVDLNTDKIVDFNDVMLFTDYWLEKTDR